MARKIYWIEPSEDAVTTTYIYRSSDKGGTYTELISIDATNDGNTKSDMNAWVLNYTDSDGSDDHWYKIRFYDGTYYSDYSNAITSSKKTKLCSIDDIKQIVDTIGKWTDKEIWDEIVFQDGLIYTECGRPIAETRIIIDKDYYKYYLGEPNIYRLDRVFYGTTTKTEQYKGDDYKTDLTNGIIRLLPTGSGGPELDGNCSIWVRYVPGIFSKLCVFRVAKALLDKTDTTHSGKISNEAMVINKKLEVIEQYILDRLGPNLSSDHENYDPEYGIKAKSVLQDFDINSFIYSED